MIRQLGVAGVALVASSVAALADPIVLVCDLTLNIFKPKAEAPANFKDALKIDLENRVITVPIYNDIPITTVKDESYGFSRLWYEDGAQVGKVEGNLNRYTGKINAYHYRGIGNVRLDAVDGLLLGTCKVAKPQF